MKGGGKTDQRPFLAGFPLVPQGGMVLFTKFSAVRDATAILQSEMAYMEAELRGGGIMASVIHGLVSLPPV